MSDTTETQVEFFSSLKGWESDVLQYKLAGYRNTEIAVACGKSQQAVSDLINTLEFQREFQGQLERLGISNSTAMLQDRADSIIAEVLTYGTLRFKDRNEDGSDNGKMVTVAVPPSVIVKEARNMLLTRTRLPLPKPVGGGSGLPEGLPTATGAGDIGAQVIAEYVAAAKKTQGETVQ